MLILTRKLDEAVIIDSRIRVVVIGLRGDRVRLGIEAPEEITVHRHEVQAAIERDGGPCRVRKPRPRAEG